MAMLPKLKLKALVSFPANVIGGTGIGITKTSGNFTVDLDYSEFAFQGSLPTGSNVLVWDPVSNVYTLIPPSSTGGISDAPTDSKVYGRKNAAWIDAWASPVLTGNPTAPTPTAGDNDTSIATTAFVGTAIAAIPAGTPPPAPATATPIINGVGAVGVSLKYAREDHVHPAGAAGSGDVVGPAGAIADRVAVFSGTTGKLIKDGGKTIAELNQIGVIAIKVFTASGTYTPSAKMTTCVIECVGAGGAGGGTVNAGTNIGIQGGSGGSGSVSRRTSLSSAIGVSQVVTIGAGGSGAAGSSGGDTSVGSLCVGKGGSCGIGHSGGGSTPGGAGGVVGTGDVTATGWNGAVGVGASNIIITWGIGANSPYGGGGSIATQGNGGNATGYGAGGSGGASWNGSGTTIGGNGSAGLIIITEYGLA